MKKAHFEVSGSVWEAPERGKRPQRIGGMKKERSKLAGIQREIGKTKPK